MTMIEPKWPSLEPSSWHRSERQQASTNEQALPKSVDDSLKRVQGPDVETSRLGLGREPGLGSGGDDEILLVSGGFQMDSSHQSIADQVVRMEGHDYGALADFCSGASGMRPEEGHTDVFDRHSKLNSGYTAPGGSITTQASLEPGTGSMWSLSPLSGSHLSTLASQYAPHPPSHMPSQHARNLSSERLLNDVIDVTTGNHHPLQMQPNMQTSHPLQMQPNMHTSHPQLSSLHRGHASASWLPSHASSLSTDQHFADTPNRLSHAISSQSIFADAHKRETRQGMWQDPALSARPQAYVDWRVQLGTMHCDATGPVVPSSQDFRMHDARSRGPLPPGMPPDVSSPHMLQTGPAWDQMPHWRPSQHHQEVPPPPPMGMSHHQGAMQGGEVAHPMRGLQGSHSLSSWPHPGSHSTLADENTGDNYPNLSSIAQSHTMLKNAGSTGSDLWMQGRPTQPPPPGLANSHLAPTPAAAPGARTPAEHPLGEYPSRTLFVRNINIHTTDDEMLSLFSQYGEVRSMYTACKHRGFVMISYYDIRASTRAKQMLQGVQLRQRSVDIHFSVPKENASEPDLNQGTLVVFNMDSSIPRAQILELFSRFGEVKEIRSTPKKDGHKFVEFFDSRHANAALQGLNRVIVAGRQLKIELSRPGGVRRARNSHSNLQSLAENAAPEPLHSGPQGATFAPPPPPTAQDMLSHQPTPTSAPSAENLQALFTNLMQLQAARGTSLSQAAPPTQPDAPRGLPITQPPPPPRQARDSVEPVRSAASTPPSAMQPPPPPAHVKPISPHDPSCGSQCSTNSAEGADPQPSVLATAEKGAAALSAATPVQPSDSASSLDSVYSALLRRIAAKPSGSPTINDHSGNAASIERSYQDVIHRVMCGDTAGPPQPPLDTMPTSGPSSHFSSPAAPPPPPPPGSPSRNNSHIAATLAAAAASAAAALARDATIPQEEHEARLHQHLMEQLSLMHRHAMGQMVMDDMLSRGLQNLPPGMPISSLSGGGRASDGDFDGASDAAGAFKTPVGSPTRPRPITTRKPTTHSDTGYSPTSSHQGASYGAASFNSSLEHGESGKRGSHCGEQFVLHRDTVGPLDGQDNRTTLMIRNIPNKYSQKVLMQTIDKAGFYGKYDFFYLPIDFKNRCNVGYAFINMADTPAVLELYDEFHNKGWERFNSEKRCCVAYARIQSRRALITHFQNSSLMHEDQRCRPVLLNLTGESPEAESFPPPRTRGCRGGASRGNRGTPTGSSTGRQSLDSPRASSVRLSGEVPRTAVA